MVCYETLPRARMTVHCLHRAAGSCIINIRLAVCTFCGCAAIRVRAFALPTYRRISLYCALVRYTPLPCGTSCTLPAAWFWAFSPLLIFSFLLNICKRASITLSCPTGSGHAASSCLYVCCVYTFWSALGLALLALLNSSCISTPILHTFHCLAPLVCHHILLCMPPFCYVA